MTYSPQIVEHHESPSGSASAGSEGGFVVPGCHHGRMSGWHPMLMLTEEQPGMWSMKEGAELRPFGGIAIRRTEAGIRYKVALGNEIIGWATSLRVASERLWRAHIEQGRERRAGRPNEWPK